MQKASFIVYKMPKNKVIECLNIQVYQYFNMKEMKIPTFDYV